MTTLPDDHSVACHQCERVVPRSTASLIETPIDRPDESGYDMVPVPWCRDCQLEWYGHACDVCGRKHMDIEGAMLCCEDRFGPIVTDGGYTKDDRDRLFVPLTTEHYRNFENGSKDVELRGYSHQFNMETVVPGRTVELRRGYSTNDSLWGIIEHVHHHKYLTKIADNVDHTRILPGSTREEFEASVHELLGDYNQFISFQVQQIDRSQERGECDV